MEADDTQSRRPWRRFLVPSVVGLMLLAVLTLVVAGASTRRTFAVVNPNFVAGSSTSVGVPTWFERVDAGAGPVTDVHWLNVLAYAAVAYLLTMPLGRLVTDLARPIRAGPIYAGVAVACVLGAVLAGGAISRWYWGYWFARPALDARVAEARTLDALTPIDTASAATPGEFGVRGTSDWSDDSRLAGGRDPGDYYTLQGRVLNALEDAGHDLSAAPRRSNDELIGLHALFTGTGYFDARAAPLTGYAVDLAGPRQGEAGLLLLTLSGGQVSNDHFPYYELLFGPPLVAGDESTRPLLSATRFYYDVAGLEGMEWFTIALALGVVALIVAMPTTAVVLSVMGLRRRQESRRRGFAVEPLG